MRLFFFNTTLGSIFDAVLWLYNLYSIQRHMYHDRSLSQSNTMRLKIYTLLAVRHYSLACVQTEEVFWLQRHIALYCTWNELDNFFVIEAALLYVLKLTVRA